MYRLGLVLISLTLVAGGPQIALAQNLTACASNVTDAPKRLGKLGPSLQGKAVLVRIHADWCASCGASQPTLDKILKTYSRMITYVEFDVTNLKTTAAAAQKAKRLGLGRFFEAYKSATSTVGIINPGDGVVVATLYGDSDALDYSRALDRVLRDLAKT